MWASFSRGVEHGGIMSAHHRSQRSLARLRSRQLIGLAALFALLAALLYATVLAAPAGARRRSPPTRRELAERLLKLDPGRRLGGDTIVGVSNGALLLGVPNRINFMIALGSGETIVGGNRADQLGALGKNATIRGGAGNDSIHGGPGHDTIYSGSGDDLITDTKGSATIYLGTGRNEVDVAGHSGRDRVLCAPGSVDRIYANRGDYIAPSCRKAPGSQVVYHQPPLAKPPSAGANGCKDNPDRDCTFLARSGRLPHFWASDSWQFLKCCDCPNSHPFLINKDYVASSIFVVRGLEPRGNVDWFLSVEYGRNPNGNAFGYAFAASSGSVTNWSFRAEDWELWLHCTSDKSQGYKCPICLPKRPSGSPSQGSEAVTEERKAVPLG
jgi:hypothetical protein